MTEVTESDQPPGLDRTSSLVEVGSLGAPDPAWSLVAPAMAIVAASDDRLATRGYSRLPGPMTTFSTSRSPGLRTTANRPFATPVRPPVGRDADDFYGVGAVRAVYEIADPAGSGWRRSGSRWSGG